MLARPYVQALTIHSWDCRTMRALGAAKHKELRQLEGLMAGLGMFG
jgi:hypothetical protein